MGKYTAYGQEVDDYIQKNYLDKIVKVFVQDCKPVSILLFGGFGKGEGSVHFVDGKPVPFNDFDLYVITEDKMSDDDLDRMSMNASREIGMGGLEIAYFPQEGYDSKKYFHVDVRCLTRDKLDSLMSIQRYYELRHGTQVIYGEDILKEMKDIRAEDLPVSDGLRNLFNKLHTMLLGLQRDYNEDQRRIRIFWSYKCYMSICESLLMLDNKFAPTASERCKIFSEIYETNFSYLYERLPEMVDKVKKATDFKLKPDFNVDADELWNQSLRDILRIFEYYVRRISGSDNVGRAINEKLPYSYFEPFLKEKIGFNLFPAQYVLNLGYLNVLYKEKEFYLKPLFNWKDVGLRMILPIYYLLKFKSDNDERWLDIAYGELQKFIRIEGRDFWHLRERALKAYGLYYEQRLL